jgi:hypothetical protein
VRSSQETANTAARSRTAGSGMKDRERSHASVRRPATQDDQFPTGSRVSEPENGWTAGNASRHRTRWRWIIVYRHRPRPPGGHGNVGPESGRWEPTSWPTAQDAKRSPTDARRAWTVPQEADTDLRWRSGSHLLVREPSRVGGERPYPARTGPWHPQRAGGFTLDSGHSPLAG